MRLIHTIAAGTAWVAMAVSGTAQAGQPGGPMFYRPHHGLPPISGTIRIAPGGFGGHRHGSAYGWDAGHARMGTAAPFQTMHRYGPRYGDQGRVFGQPRLRFGYGAAMGLHHYGPAYGDQGRANARMARGGYGYRYAYTAPRREVGWRGDGTGLVGLIGNAGNPFAGAQTGWGTADSATTGGAYPLPSARSYHAEAPLQVTYGEPDLWASGGRGYASTGGLAYYNSGSPGRMAYYSSGSSAYGSTGGLGTYSSGSYGAPSIIHIGRRHIVRRDFSQGCTCGPHIISLNRHHRHYASW